MPPHLRGKTKDSRYGAVATESEREAAKTKALLWLWEKHSHLTGAQPPEWIQLELLTSEAP